MAASKPVVLPGDDIAKEIECRVCMEQITLRILTCGHKCCQDCIGMLCLHSLLHFFTIFGALVLGYKLWFLISSS